MITDEIAKTEKILQATVRIMENLLEENQHLKDKIVEKMNEIISLNEQLSNLQRKCYDLANHNRSLENDYWNKP